MHVDPIKPTLKPTGTKCLKLKCDVLLSTSAFKFNLRRYNLDMWGSILIDDRASVAGSATPRWVPSMSAVGRCRSTLSNPR